MRKAIILGALLFAGVFSFSTGFHATLTAGDWVPQPCSSGSDLGNCCEVGGAGTGIRGVCVEMPDHTMSCRCDCIFQQWPTCGGPKNCHLDDCTGEPQ